MILVLLGTQNNSFFRLLDEIENCIKTGIISEEVVVQAGHTLYHSDNACYCSPYWCRSCNLFE